MASVKPDKSTIKKHSIIAIIAIAFWYISELVFDFGPDILYGTWGYFLTGIASSIFADIKNRNHLVWFALGLWFAIFPIIVLFVLPKLHDRLCPECREGIAIDANICPHCRSDVKISGNSPNKKNDAIESIDPTPHEEPDNLLTHEKVGIDSSNWMKKNRLSIIIGLLFLLFVYNFSQQKSDSKFAKNTSTSETTSVARLSCYWQGYRYGKCATYVLYGQKCPPEFDIVLSPYCQHNSDAERGIADGVKKIKDEF